jgi:hypothetical protein
MIGPMRLPVATWLLLAACAEFEPDVSAPAGVVTYVECLSGGFVSFEGARVPTEDFVVEMRQRVRTAQQDPSRMPAVRIRVEDAVPDASVIVGRLIHELRQAGVRTVELWDA